jgi:hypothetical protein
MTRRSGRLSSRAWRWGWQGGTGWHAGDRCRATPLFYWESERWAGFRSRRHPLSPIMISTRTRLSAPESPSKAGESGEIFNKIWGWHAFMHVATPSLIANARESPRIHRFAREYARARGGPICCAAATTEAVGPEPAEKPIKQGVARGCRVSCHPVPPCHPQRCA